MIFKFASMIFHLFAVSLCISSQNLIGHWQGSIFNHTKHLEDFSIMLLNDNDGTLKGSAWIASSNSSLSQLSDTFLGILKISQDKSNQTVTFFPNSDPEPLKFELDSKTWKNSQITTSGDELKHSMKYKVQLNPTNLVLHLKDEYSMFIIHAFHDKLPDIPGTEKKITIVYILVGSLLGVASVLILFAFCFGDQNIRPIKKEKLD